MSLTLEQVKQAGRFAWHERSEAFVPGHGVIWFDWHWEGYGSNEVAVMHVEDDWLPTATHDDGWHHLSSCDCEFCGGEKP